MLGIFSSPIVAATKYRKKFAERERGKRMLVNIVVPAINVQK